MNAGLLGMAKRGEAPRVTVARTTDQTIAQNTVVAAIWTVALHDPLGFWNPAEPTLLRVPSGMDGLYFVSLQSSWEGVGSTPFQWAWVRRNSVQLADSRHRAINSSPGSYTRYSATTISPLAAGDVIAAEVYHNNGAVSTWKYDPDFAPRLTLIMLTPCLVRP